MLFPTNDLAHRFYSDFEQKEILFSSNVFAQHTSIHFFFHFTNIFYFLLFLEFFKDFMYLFLERGEGKGEREGEKHQCVVASHAPPTWGPGPQTQACALTRI